MVEIPHRGRDLPQRFPRLCSIRRKGERGIQRPSKRNPAFEHIVVVSQFENRRRLEYPQLLVTLPPI